MNMVSRGGGAVKRRGCATFDARSATDRSILRVLLAELSGAAVRPAKIGAVEIFAKIHEREESAEDAGLEIIRERQAAGGDTTEAFAVLGDELDDFALALVRSIAQGGFAAHLGAAIFHR